MRYLRHLFPIGAALLVILTGACNRQGCTDKNALNYNSLANKDDGSCLYCEREYAEIGSSSVDVFDYNFSSSFYNTVVARIHVDQVSNHYNFGSCGQNECKVYYRVENVVYKRMSFFYSLTGSGAIFFSTGTKFTDIPAYQTSVTDSALASTSFGGFCDRLTSNELFINIQGNIAYY